jgi:hypothetical protein
MGTIGHGYGSEWHLLRHLGYHRKYLTQKVLKETGGDSIDWLDFDFSKENKPLKDDREHIGVDCIPGLQSQWAVFWPQSGIAQNWDAVGRITYGNQTEWLLVEAKGHLGEVKSECKASTKASHDKISSHGKICAALKNTSTTFSNGSQPLTNWLSPYYQYANRLAVLHFLMNECNPPVHARLLFLYFYGEKRRGLKCPTDKGKWQPTVDAINAHLGIDKTLVISQRIHSLFLPVNPEGIGERPETESCTLRRRP